MRAEWEKESYKESLSLLREYLSIQKSTDFSGQFDEVSNGNEEPINNLRHHFDYKM